MLCDKCKRNAAIYHSQTVINGIVNEEHLCESCASQNNSSFAQFVSNVFDESLLDMFGFEDALCGCGTKFSDIIRSGVVGCNNCENSYKGILSDAMNSIRIGADKARKEMSSGDFERKKQITSLRNQIAEAVEREDYEKASELKKEIDKLNSNKEGENV